MTHAKTTWYAEPLDVISNGIIATFIGGDEDRKVHITCSDGAVRDLWHLRDYADYRALSKNQAVRAKFFVRRGNGWARNWPFPKRKGNPSRSGRQIGEELLAKTRAQRTKV